MTVSVRDAAPTSVPSKVEGAVAVVTGGGSGLGAAICRELSGAGASVVVADLDRSAAERVARDAGRAEPLQLDVADERSASEGITSVLERAGRIDILVNCAGVDRTAAFEELSIEEWDRIIGVNLRGPVVVTRAAWPAMAAARQGSIVNITSTAATRAWANASAYHATKWGLLGLSRALHVEGRRVGIAVTAVIAGGMETPFLLDRFPDIDRSVLQDPASVARVIRSVLEAPRGTVVPEVMVLPDLETSWP